MRIPISLFTIALSCVLSQAASINWTNHVANIQAETNGYFGTSVNVGAGFSDARIYPDSGPAVTPFRLQSTALRLAGNIFEVSNGPGFLILSSDYAGLLSAPDLLLTGDAEVQGTVRTDKLMATNGVSAGVGSAVTSITNLLAVGTSAGQGMSLANSIDVYLIGYEASESMATTDCGNIYSLGDGNLVDASLYTSYDIYAIGAINMDIIVCTNVSDIFGVGSYNLLSSYLTNCSEVFGFGHDNLRNSVLSDTQDLIALGSKAGTNIVGSYTNVVLIGKGADPGPTSQNKMFVGGGATPMTVVFSGNLQLGTTANTNLLYATGTNLFWNGNSVNHHTRYLTLMRPDYGDGTKAVPQTNDFTASGLMHYTFAGDGETNTCWVVYETVVPPDIDTSVEMTATIAFVSGGTDTDTVTFHLTYALGASGTALPTGTGIATSPIVVTTTPTTPASGDVQQSAATTLTGWAASMTAGTPLFIRMARLNDSNDDTQRDLWLRIAYGSIQ